MQCRIPNEHDRELEALAKKAIEKKMIEDIIDPPHRVSMEYTADGAEIVSHCLEENPECEGYETRFDLRTRTRTYKRPLPPGFEKFRHQGVSAFGHPAYRN